MNFKVKFTDTAKEDLRNIATYIADQSKDSRVAIHFVNELRAKTKILEMFPESGAMPSDRVMRAAEYRFLVHKEYLIFYHYEHKESTSYILAVFNAKRDYTRVMRKIITLSQEKIQNSKA